MSPEAIAKRVAALGGDDEIERLAREEELKLAERRAKTGGGKEKKSGLEAAASKRLQKIGEKAPPKRVASPRTPTCCAERDLSPMVPRESEGGHGLAIVTWSPRPAEGVRLVVPAHRRPRPPTRSPGRQRRGRPDRRPDKDDEDTHPKDLRPVFKTDAERRDAALAKYREVEAKYKGPGRRTRAPRGGLAPPRQGGPRRRHRRVRRGEPVAARRGRRGGEGARARGARVRVRGEGEGNAGGEGQAARSGSAGSSARSRTPT